MTSIVIPNGVSRIEGSAFSGCTNLTSVSIPNSVTSIEGYAFNDTRMSSVIIPDRCQSIGDNAFSWNYQLESVFIPSSVTSIGGEAFACCSSLTSITIPEGVNSIGWGAFSGCSSLTSITVLIKEPLPIDAYTFDRGSATLYVPYGSKPAYEVADYWKEFNEIIELDPTEIPITISSAGIATYCSEFNLDFTETDVKAYIVSAFTPRTGKVILTRVYDVPAGTGIVVMGDAGEHQISVVEAQAVVSNMLVGVTETMELNKVDGDYTNYVFDQKNGELGFYVVADGFTLGAHEAYLPLPTAKIPSSAGVKIAFMFDDGNVTGIDDVTPTLDTPTNIYDICGQRLNGLRKGVNIVDGKKVYVK